MPSGSRSTTPGFGPTDVGMIVAHANGTRQSDASEAAALLRVFRREPPPVTGFKWAFGHLIAASGIIETVVALSALRARTVPGIATFSELDPACAGLPVSSASVHAPQRRRAGDLARIRRHERSIAGAGTGLVRATRENVALSFPPRDAGARAGCRPGTQDTHVLLDPRLRGDDN